MAKHTMTVTYDDEKMCNTVSFDGDKFQGHDPDLTSLITVFQAQRENVEGSVISISFNREDAPITTAHQLELISQLMTRSNLTLQHLIYWSQLRSTKPFDVVLKEMDEAENRKVAKETQDLDSVIDKLLGDA